MKKFLVVFFSALLLAVIVAPSTAEAQNQSYGVCYAYTSCQDGHTISCRVQGNSSAGVACTWAVSPYYAVECDGYIWNGYAWMWQSYYITC